MRPSSLKTRIFLDSGDPQETKTVMALLGFLDGQTTNPTLIAKHPDARERLARGEKFTKEEIIEFYRKVVKEISSLILEQSGKTNLFIPAGSVSVEVYADKGTSKEEMTAQGKEMFSWIPNAHIKYPTTRQGLEAAGQSVSAGMRVNMTLCFTQEQAAAVYGATKGAAKGDVFVSPFVGRLDDRGVNGMDLISNIIRMYNKGDGHVEVLAASVRNAAHFMQAIALGSDIITAPFGVLKEWAEKGMPLPGENFSYEPENLSSIPYKDIDLGKDWRELDIAHELTDKGIERFASDWNELIS